MTDDSEWVEIGIDEEMLAEAKVNVEKYNDYNLFGGAKNQKLAGEVGRLALRKDLDKNKIVYKEDKHIGSKDQFDFIVNGKNTSLKTQLLNNKFVPLPRYRCEVNEQQLDNPCDDYVFAKVNLNLKKVWLVGCISKKRFDKEGILQEKGKEMSDNATKWAVEETKKDVTILSLDPLKYLYK